MFVFQKASNRFLGWAAGAAAMALATLSPFPAEAQDAWPADPITIIVGSDAGGGHDRMGRGLATFLAKDFGIPVTVENKPGGSTRLSVEYFLQQPQDGSAILIAAPAPFWVTHIERDGATYGLDDFVMLNVQWPDYSGLFLRADLPIKDAGELIADMKANSGKYSVGVISNSTEAINLYLLLETVGVPVENLRVVEYDNNAALRAAIVGEQLDMALSPLESSGPIIGSVAPLGVFSASRSYLYPDIPTVNEVLGPLGFELPVIPSSVRGPAVTRKFKDEYPDRFAKLMETYEKIATSPEFQAAMAETQTGHEWMGDETDEFVRNAYDMIKQYQPLLDKYR
jgi:putative tricarboxylic transport membrane protein